MWYNLKQENRLRTRHPSANSRECFELPDTFEITVDEYGNMGIKIDVETLKVSPYIAFSYCDFKKSDIEKGHYDVEELEQDLTTKLLESSFALFLKAHSPDYIVSVWDDGCYMCPGYVKILLEMYQSN